jgi:hypothetical protein
MFNLSKEIVIEIGPVNLCVTQLASVLLGCHLGIHDRRMPECGSGVAGQAQQADVAVLQHVRVGPAVRYVAGRAAFRFHSGMFEHERPLLVGMTLETDHIARGRSSHLADLVSRLPIPTRTMLIVTIRALNQPFVYTMTKRHIELGFLLCMARVAKLRLSFYQQFFRCSCVMRRVTANTTHIILPVE